MKIAISLDCSGHGTCHRVNAELFPLDEDGFSAADGNTVAPEQEDDARYAAKTCPAQAITLVED